MNGEAKSGTRDLEDFYSEEVCRVWFYLEEFCLSLAQVSPEDELPDWLEVELMPAGWDEILGIPGSDDERAAWALEHGIAPGQAFLMEIKPPHYFRCGNPFDGEEWDCEYDATFLGTEPMPLAEAADQWEAWINAGYSPYTDGTP